MPAKREGPTLKDVLLQVLAELTEPALVNDIVQRVLERYPAASKNSPKSARQYLHSYDLMGVELVYLDSRTIAPLHLAMAGICFRVPLDANEAGSGLLSVLPGFIPFLIDRYSYLMARGGIEVRDENDQIISNGPVTRAIQVATASGGQETLGCAVFDLHDWLRARHARSGDSLQVTILNWRPARLLFEFEPQSAYRKDVIAAQDRALADCIQSLLDESYDERLYTNPTILTAYARMPNAHGYPGQHWFDVLAKDPRFFINSFEIMASEGYSTQDFMRDPFAEPKLKGQPFTSTQGNKVYRFKAKENYGSQKHAVELLGKHTLADFDSVMRSAFDLDFFDHLSEFTHITSRGKGKKPREQQYGEINPFEPTPAMELQLAGLGLEVGAELEYLYDFGDSLRHTLVLQDIGDAEQGVKYPRVVKS